MPKRVYRKLKPIATIRRTRCLLSHLEARGCWQLMGPWWFAALLANRTMRPSWLSGDLCVAWDTSSSAPSNHYATIRRPCVLWDLFAQVPLLQRLALDNRPGANLAVSKKGMKMIRTVPYRTVPCPAVAYHAVPCRSVPHRSVPCRAVPCRKRPQRAMDPTLKNPCAED